MNYSSKEYADVLFTDEDQYNEQEYVEVPKSEFAAYAGSDPNDLYTNLSDGSKDFPGYYMPDSGSVNDDYLGRVYRGKQKVFYKTSINIIDPYKHTFHGVDFVAAEIRKYKEVLAYFPKRYHRTGPNNKKLILDDRSFIYSIFAKVKPAEYDQFMATADRLWRAEKKRKKNLTVRVPKVLWNKIKKVNIEHTDKGRSASIIVNQPSNEKRKRAVYDKMSSESIQNLVKDKVYFPPDDLQEPTNPSLDKDFVLTSSYVKIRDQYASSINELKNFQNSTIKTPWITTKNIQDNQARENSYNHIRDSLLKQYNWNQLAIPTMTAAWNLWHNE